MQPNECNQVNATKWMQPSECNQLNATTVQSVSNPKQSNINEMFSQTSKFSRGNRVNNGGEGLQQSSMGAVDMLVDLTDGGNGN